MLFCFSQILCLITVLGSTMVQEYQSPVRVYKYPFEIVMAVSELPWLMMVHGLSMSDC